MVVNDVTEPNQKSEVSAAWNNCNEIVFFLDADYNVIAMNAPVKRYFGWQPGEVVGSNFIQLCVDKRVMSCLPDDMSALLAGQVVRTETTIKKNKQVISILWTVEKSFDSNNAHSGFILLGRDLNLQRTYDNNVDLLSKLSRRDDFNPAQHYLEQFCDHIPGIIFWKDRNGCYQGCNDYMLAACMLSKKKDLIGKYDKDLWPEEAAQLRSTDLTVMQENKSIAVEESATLKNGSKLYNTVVKSPLKDHKGNIIGVIGNALDISKIKQQ